MSSRFFRTRSNGAKFKSVPVQNWKHITPISRIEWTLQTKIMLANSVPYHNFKNTPSFEIKTKILGIIVIIDII